MLTNHEEKIEEKVDIPEVCISEEDSTPPSPVVGQPPWDGKTEWTSVSHGPKNKTKRELKMKDPVFATRQSLRIQTNDNGIPIQRRAELRASKKNDITGMHSGFHVFNNIPNADLELLAVDSKVVLGEGRITSIDKSIFLKLKN